MNLTKQTRNSGAVEVKRALRWDLVGLLLAFVIAIALISVLDTGSLAEWVAKHKESKIDEVIVASITLLIGVSFFFLRRWLGLSHRLIKYEDSQEIDHVAARAGSRARRRPHRLELCAPRPDSSSSRNVRAHDGSWRSPWAFVFGQWPRPKHARLAIYPTIVRVPTAAGQDIRGANCARLGEFENERNTRVQSVRDPLTGLYNRRYMEESLDRELRRAKRKNVVLGLMMLDVDHFKHFNDTFGHEAGDSVLRSLGTLLRTQFRGEDIVCRYGGEEFVVILPEASLELTQQRAEQLREAVKKDLVQFRGQSLGAVSLSIGVSSFPPNGITGEALVGAADAALYRAKEEGRDRVSSPTLLDMRRSFENRNEKIAGRRDDLFHHFRLVRNQN